MAKLSYRRLAAAMVELLADHTLAQVAQGAAEAMSSGGHHPQLERLIPELERELARQAGHITVHASSARALPPKVMENLAAELCERLGGKTYELDTTINPNLLGGVRLTTADSTLDLSLRNRLETIRTYHG